MVTLNGNQIGEGYWDGASAHELAVEFDPGLLIQGNNNVEVTGLLDDGCGLQHFLCGLV